MENYKNILDDIVNDIDPAEQRRTNQRMLLAAIIEDGMKAKGWKKKDLMKAVGIKNQSVITKWFSGTHNFTADTLFDIQHALGIDLFNLSSHKSEVKKVYKGTAILRVSLNIETQFNGEGITRNRSSFAFRSSSFIAKTVTD